MEQKNISYLEIFKESFRITWENKFLWFFGFFIMAGTATNSFIWELGDIQKDWFFIMTISVFFLAFFLLLSVGKIIGQTAIIIFSGKETLDKNIGFRKLFKKSSRFIWKLLLLDLLLAMVILLVASTLSVPVIFLIFAKSELSAFIVGLFALVIFIPLATLAFFIKKFSYIYIILSDLDILNSIENSYLLFKKNIIESLMMLFFLLLAGLACALALFITLVIVGMPLIFVVFSLSLIMPKIITVFIATIFIAITTLIFITVRSIFETFGQISWTLFFKNIAGIKIDEKEILKETLPIKEAVGAENA